MNTVTLIGAVLLFFVLVFSVLSFTTRMAAIVGWVLQNIIGIRVRQAPLEETDSSASSKDSSSSKKSEDPVFSTNLTEPIENIIEETLSEELKSKSSQPSPKKKGKSKSVVTKQENKQLSKPVQSTEKETGQTSVKSKSTEPTKGDKSTKKKVPAKNKDDTIYQKSVEEELPQEDIGVSFSPVKGKGSKRKSSSDVKVKDNEYKKQKDDPAKASAKDYKRKETKQALETAVSPKKSGKVLEKSLIVSVSEEKSQVEDRNKTEIKESKKVSSSVSYASVVTNKIPESEDNFEIILNPEEELIHSFTLVESINQPSDKEVEESSSVVIPSNIVYESVSQIEEKVNEPVKTEATDDFETCSASKLETDTVEESSNVVIPSNIDHESVSQIEEKVNEPVKTDATDDFETCSASKLETDTVEESSSVVIPSNIVHESVSQIEEKVNEPVKTEATNDFETCTASKLETDTGKIEHDSLDSEKQAISLENSSKSNSSSIEVICEEQSSIDSQNNFFENIGDFDISADKETQKQYEIIKETVNKLIQSTTESDLNSDTACGSETSSIYVLDTQTETEEAEINKREKIQTELVSDSDPKLDPLSVNQKPVTTEKDLCAAVEDPQEKSQERVQSELTNRTDLQDIEVESSCKLKKKVDTTEKLQPQESAKEKTLDEILDEIFEVDYFVKLGTLKIIENVQDTFTEKQIEEPQELEATEEVVGENSEPSVFKIEENNYIPQVVEELEVQIGIEENISKHSEIEVHKFKLEIQNNLVDVHETTENFLKSEKLESTETNRSENRVLEGTLEVFDTDNNIRSVVDQPSIYLQDSEHPQEHPVTSIKEVKSEKLSKRYSQLDMAASQIRVLTLNNQEHQECTLYRIEKNWAIQFRIGPSLFGRKVYLYCNYPVEEKGALVKFNRNKYQLLNWALDEGCKNADDTAAYTEILAKLAGSFHYYFTFENRDGAERQGSGFFLVDPVLKYGKNEDLPLDCVQCQTVLSKSLGSFSTWEKKLQVAKESGYNMIHFTPIQELGASNSSYSLKEQLKFNPVFKKDNGKIPTFEEMKQFISKIRKDWKVTSICDIVLNHTANESEWIKVHPEVTYNCVNCPYMRPAYLLDAAFHQFSLDVKKGLYEDKGIPIEVNNEEHLNAIRYHFRLSVLDSLKIEELYTCNASKLAAEFSALARITTPTNRNFRSEEEEITVIQDKEYKRLGSTVDMTLALKLYNVYRNDTFDEDSRVKRCTEEFKSKLDSLNSAIVAIVNDHLKAAVDNVIAGIRYFRVEADGPKVKEITVKNPLVYRYFTDHGTPKSIKEHEDIMYSKNGCFLMAHNGWVMNSDPLKNFAAPDSNVYLRRELIAWGDSVKLRFGNEPKDCPFLWEHMKKYVEQTAEIFDGVRLDNCHSTPIPVAEYLLDCARRVKPDLYVVAELFTNSDMTDNIFVNRLGITSLIREAMAAWDSHEQGRLVYRYGGSPVGSFYQPRIRPLVPSIAHALFLDLTHDNPCPVERRSVFDFLPSAALVNMACCASGSNRGYDELVPHHIHVVDETRQYTEWTEDENLAMGNLRYVTKKSGIIPAKKALNDIHFALGKEGYNQVYVDQMDPDIVAVTRHRPDTHESYILVAFTAFSHPGEDAAYHQRGIRLLRFEGVLDEIVLEATLSHVSSKSGGSKFARWNNFVKDSKWVNGLSEYQVTLKQHIQLNESDIFEKVDSNDLNVTQLNFKNFKPGSVVVIKTSLPETMRDAITSVRALINQFSLTKETELTSIIEKLTLADLNRAIYRCDQEERDEGFGFDTYNIPGFGSPVYAGLQGFISFLATIRPNNDLGHPMCANLRDGNWMLDYIWQRLKLDIGTRDLGQWIEENTKCFNNIPRYLVPSYFDVVVTGIYVLLIEQCYKLMSNFVNHGSTFVRGLSLGSVQFGAYIKSADLPVLSPNLAPPKPPTRKNEKGENVQACITLSAGLPHFAVGYMRNWGRDTFIALRGLFILTGRFEEARQHILGYGACLRHGLIPNLLDGGRNSRFNCRDAVWWWLHCIKDYVEEAPNGIEILKDQVSRIFPTDDSPAQPPGAFDQPLHDVMQEALKVHFQGLAFRERNAGKQIDEHMTDRGFNNQIGIHPETGFVFGGNEWNCGTWMDKMGSSDKAGNRGKPATPRDGSAVELIGLSKAVISWLWKLSQEKKYPYSSVERTHRNGSITKWTFKEWSDKIQANFEKYFWVNDTPVSGEYRPDLINKRGIYKDSYGATQTWTDFQLRCNFPIAMVVAPELFNPQHAWAALKQAEKYLMGPLGMKTLDPEDWAYRGDYDNSNDSEDSSIAHGFNYHQGPEWVWPVGFFLRAKLHFASLNGALPETLANTKVVLSKHFTELQTSVWRGLPELTNSNGSYCKDSSRTQAWSMSCILEVLHDLQKIESKQPILIN